MCLMPTLNFQLIQVQNIFDLIRKKKKEKDKHRYQKRDDLRLDTQQKGLLRVFQKVLLRSQHNIS